MKRMTRNQSNLDLTKLKDFGLPSTRYILRITGPNSPELDLEPDVEFLEEPPEYHIILDYTAVWSTHNFIEAFQYFFAITYVYKRTYHEEAAATLPFIQEHIGLIKAKEGSKSRQNAIVTQQVLGLYNKLRDVNVT